MHYAGTGRIDKWWLCRSCRLYRLSARRRSLSEPFLLLEIHIRLLAGHTAAPCSFYWQTHSSWLTWLTFGVRNNNTFLEEHHFRHPPQAFVLFAMSTPLRFGTVELKSIPSIHTPCWAVRLLLCPHPPPPPPWTVTIRFLIMLYNATKRLPNRGWCIRSAGSLSQSQAAFFRFSF